MDMELITYAEYGEPLTLTQQLMAEMLGTVGIHLDLSVVEGSVLWADYASGGIEQSGDFDMDIYDDGYAGVDPTDFLYQYYSADAPLNRITAGTSGAGRTTEFDCPAGRSLHAG